MANRKLLLATLVVMATLAVAAPVQAGAGRRVVTIRLTNLTSAQVFSPPLFAIGPNPDVFTLGEEASLGVKAIAEQGDNSILASDLAGEPGVREVVAMSEPVLPGDSVRLKVRLQPGDHLSVLTMLVQTNDGFTGISRLALDSFGRGSIGLVSFDAGSEVNNELAEYVPGPPFGGQLRAPEHGVITYHDGIEGVGDLDPATYDWTDPVSRLTIQQVPA